MRRNHSSFLSVLVVLLCIALIGSAGYLLYKTLPQKKPATVETLSTEMVFGQDSSVSPIREEEYAGELPDALTASEETPPAELPKPAEQTAPAEQPAAPVVSEEQKQAEAILALMTTEEKVWQLMFVTPESLTGVETATVSGETTKKALEAMPVGGIVYFSANLEDELQAQLMLSNVQTYTRIPLFLGVDEEGGIVQRIGKNALLGGKEIPSMQSLGSAGDPAAVYAAGGDIAGNLKHLGFNLDFAPVADVAEDSSAVIGSRSFGSDPRLCASLVSVLSQSLRDHNIISCLKHFPGYGSASGDDHNGPAFVQKSLAELEASDLLPFQEAINSPFIMVSHLSLPNVTGDDTPADLSSQIVTELLRNKLGFENVILTDSQQMASITDLYTCGDAALTAFTAGCDMILMPADPAAAYHAIFQAVQTGAIPESRLNESVLRILTVKAQYGLLPRPEAMTNE